MTSPPEQGESPDARAHLLHDLRQPLAAILAAASALRASSALSDENRVKLLDIIVVNADRLSDMLTGALGGTAPEP